MEFLHRIGESFRNRRQSVIVQPTITEPPITTEQPVITPVTAAPTLPVSKLVQQPETIKIVDDELMNAVNGPLFTFDGLIVEGKVVDFYDGDTCTLAFRFKGEIIRIKIRMNGYDSPEMKPPKNQVNRDQEKIKAKAAREAFMSHANDVIVSVYLGKPDKYGRTLATMYSPSGVNINEWMVNNGHGYPYEGGTKKKFGEDE